jgi:N6-adenosine-specific RNA methylase IME4
VQEEIKYQTIYADPPWPEIGGGKICRGAQKHYPVMKIHEIIALKDFINKLAAENCHLYLWVTNGYLPEGLEVMKEWGFRYLNIITWKKDRMGIGQYFRGLSEQCLFGVRGRLPYKVDPVTGKRCQGRTAFDAVKGRHSEKPIEMRKMIELVSHGPRIELFARQKFEGWDSWGNEVENSVENL